MGTMSRIEEKKTLTGNDGRKRLDIFIKLSHNSDLSDKSLIQLVKLLARQAAEEDFARSINHSKSGGTSS